jgi:hypothetical protein
LYQYLMFLLYSILLIFLIFSFLSSIIIFSFKSCFHSSRIFSKLLLLWLLLKLKSVLKSSIMLTHFFANSNRGYVWHYLYFDCHKEYIPILEQKLSQLELKCFLYISVHKFFLWIWLTNSIFFDIGETSDS